MNVCMKANPGTIIAMALQPFLFSHTKQMTSNPHTSLNIIIVYRRYFNYATAFFLLAFVVVLLYPLFAICIWSFKTVVNSYNTLFSIRFFSFLICFLWNGISLHLNFPRLQNWFFFNSLTWYKTNFVEFGTNLFAVNFLTVECRNSIHYYWFHQLPNIQKLTPKNGDQFSVI